MDFLGVQKTNSKPLNRRKFIAIGVAGAGVLASYGLTGCVGASDAADGHANQLSSE
ncbi:MAG: hypothetical protein FWD27_03590 [Coriobacteriia bacterium]|nr:hypothetical protein [Coriobacteriia bacterium]